MTTYPDLVRRPATRHPDEVAAELDDARAEAEAALAELRRLEAQAPPPMRASLSLGRKVTQAQHTGDATLMLRRAAGEIREAVAAQHVWCAEVAAATADLRQALAADAALQEAVRTAQEATARADELRGRLSTRRAALGRLEAAGPGSADAAATWASEAGALRAEVEALARLVAEAEKVERAARPAVEAAQARVAEQARAQAGAAVEAARVGWQAALAEVNRKYEARVAAAERGVAVLQAALAAL